MGAVGNGVYQTGQMVRAKVCKLGHGNALTALGDSECLWLLSGAQEILAWSDCLGKYSSELSTRHWATVTEAGRSSEGVSQRVV